MRAYRTPDPQGDNSLGSRFAGAFVGALVGLPLVGLWWLWLAYASAGALVFSPMHAAVGVAALALSGFLFPRVLPGLVGGMLRVFFAFAKH